jgi:V8-like Glu-specific endopeptidase
VGLEQQRSLDEILQRYGMMTPIANTPQPAAWHGRETDESLLEKVFGENTLRPIAFLAQGLQVARSVAYIGVRNGAETWSGTGFLISRDVFVTNHHVLPSAELLSDTVVRFNYEEDFAGAAQPVSEFRPKPNGIFHTDKALDCAILQLDGNPGTTWGFISPQAGQVSRGDRVNIIQHPGGLPKQVAMQNNFVEYTDADVVQYITATQRGSSGSPVFDDAWRLIGLHHAGGYMQEPGSSHRYFRNEGIRFGRILAALPAELKAYLSTST